MLDPNHPITRYLYSRKMSVSAFSKKLGMDRTTVYRWIERSRTPGYEAILQIEKATSGVVTVNNLVAYHAPRNRGRK